MQQTSRNTKALNAVVAKQGREEGRNRNSNHYQEEGTTMVSRVAAKAQKFDTDMKSTVNHGGSTVITSINYSEWLGRHDITMNFVNRYGEVIYLDPAEARDLIAGLQAQLVFMGEEFGEAA